MISLKLCLFKNSLQIIVQIQAGNKNVCRKCSISMGSIGGLDEFCKSKPKQICQREYILGLILICKSNLDLKKIQVNCFEFENWVGFPGLDFLGLMGFKSTCNGPNSFVEYYRIIQVPPYTLTQTYVHTDRTIHKKSFQTYKDTYVRSVLGAFIESVHNSSLPNT